MCYWAQMKSSIVSVRVDSKDLMNPIGTRPGVYVLSVSVYRGVNKRNRLPRARSRRALQS